MIVYFVLFLRASYIPQKHFPKQFTETMESIRLITASFCVEQINVLCVVSSHPLVYISIVESQTICL